MYAIEKTRKTHKHNTQIRLRLLSLLLVLCMVATLLPIMSMTAFAATNDAIQEGTAVLGTGANSATAATVYFGQYGGNPIAWRVIGYDGQADGVASELGKLTLITTSAMRKTMFDHDGTSNTYSDSDLKSMIEGIASVLSNKETTLAVEKRTLTVGIYNTTTPSETEGIAGSEVADAVLWPLSTKEANAMSDDLRALEASNVDSWWLRSPGYSNDRAAVVNGYREVSPNGVSVDDVHGVRPAFYLNLSSVLFTSAAMGGKSSDAVGADALKAVADNAAGTEWKLTLKDSTRSAFTASLNTSSSTTVAADGSVSIDYSGAETGDNEYISAMIVDDSDKVLYYGNIANNSASGTNQAITIPAGLAEGNYTLKIFNEQINGDKKTDFASEFKDIPITVTAGGGTTTTYDVWVDDTHVVTSDNKDDILNDGGTASYDPSSRTLTLNGYSGGAIRANHALTVTLADGSENTVINSANNEAYCISANNNDLTINGSGDLKVIQHRYNCSAITTSAITTDTGGNLIIDMAGDLNITTDNWHGLYAYGSVTISGRGDVSICIEGKWNGNKGTGIVSETEDVILSGSGKLTVDAKNAACAVRLKTSGKALLLNGTGAPLSFSAETYKAIVNQADKTHPVVGTNLAYYNKVTGAPNTASVVYEHDHTRTLVPEKAANCTEAGNTAYYTCNCGKWFEDEDCTAEIVEHGSVVLPALGHDYKTTWSNDETKHWRECTRCGDTTDVEDHKLGAWTETKGATCTEKGEKVRTCTVCNYEEKEEIPALDHDYKTVWSNDADRHWHECTRCGDRTDVENHIFGEWTETKGATCIEKGEKVRTCTVCNYEEKEEIPALDHDYKTVWSNDADRHWHECTRCGDRTDVENHIFGEWTETKGATCIEKGEKVRTCTVCNYEEKEEIPALDHDYKTVWSNDADRHWHECTRCGDRTDVENHIFGEWTETKGATCIEKGEKVRTCTVCNYEEKEEIPALDHDYKTVWSNDADRHWHECTRCGDRTDVENHIFGEWTETKGATCIEKGEKVRTCTVCNYEEKEEIPALDHDYKTVWSNDADRHWHECTRCGDRTDVENHIFGEWTETKGATCIEKGEKVRTCTVCNYEEKEEIPALDHDYKTVWSNDADRHWHECTRCGDRTDVEDHKLGAWTETKGAKCTEKGEKVRACTVCNYEEKEEVAALGHDYKTTWSNNADLHWHECTRCDDKADVAAHTFGEWTETTPPTETEKGEKQHECTVCGYIETAEIEPTGSTDPEPVKPEDPVADTGDTTDMTRWMALLMASLGGLCVVGYKRKLTSK